MVECHKDVYRNSRLRLEYAYLLFNGFILNKINSEIKRKLLNFDVDLVTIHFDLHLPLTSYVTLGKNVKENPLQLSSLKQSIAFILDIYKV